MKKPVIIISIICVLIIAGGVLVLTGVVDLKGLVQSVAGGSSQNANADDPSDGTSGSGGDILADVSTAVTDMSGETTSQSETSKSKNASGAVVWISYMDTCVLLDKNGTVLSAGSEEPADVMQVSGVNITRMVKGEPVEVDDREAFEYGLLVTNKLAAVGISDKGEVYISADHSAIVYLKNIKILLGKEDNLLEKLEALRKFYNKVIVMDGTLDMQEYDRNKMGYTFKVNGGDSSAQGNTDETVITEDDDDDGSGDEDDENYGSEDDGSEDDDSYYENGDSADGEDT